MNTQESISTRIDRIVETFQAGRKAAEENENHDKLISILNAMDSEFRSMAFEGASMGIALRGLSKDAEHLAEWLKYLDGNTAYSTQIQIGLGWALADRDLNPTPIVHQLNPIMQGRVLDGYGYFFGLFRRRLSIRTQQIPAAIPDQLLTAFNQGIGRSLWYISKGEPERLERMINAFPEGRKPDLWRGIGVAATVVGGLSENELVAILALAERFSAPLKTGCAMGASSLVRANVANNFTELTCKTWLRCSTREAVEITKVTGETHQNWVAQIEGSFGNSY